MSRAWKGHSGAALIVTMVVMLILLGLSGAMIPLARLETNVSANHRRAIQRLYSAEAALELAIHALGQGDVWKRASSGVASFPGWSRPTVVSLDDGYLFDLSRVTEELARAPAKSGALRWVLVGCAQLENFGPASSSIDTQTVAVWLANDPSAPDPGTRLILHAAALGPGPARRAIRAVVQRLPRGQVSLVSWEVAR